MRIAYVTTYDPTDIHAWSGTGYHIPEALKRAGVAVDYIGPLTQPDRLSLRLRSRAYRKLAGSVFLKNRTRFVLTTYARQVRSALSDLAVDAVFSPGTIPIAYLDTDLPIVFWTDATFAGMVDFYPKWTNLCRESIRDGNRMEQAALSRCRLAIYSSQWAANTAIDAYDVDPNKVRVVEFGANAASGSTEQEIQRLVANRPSGSCELLFVGVDWLRKGGEIAVRVAQLLNDRRIPTRLHVVGCTPPRTMPDFVVVHGFVSRATEEGRQRLNSLFANAHFLIVPSTAEAYGLVFAEASSFGLPSLAARVGGIPTVVTEGRNGKLFDPDEGAEPYASYVAGLMSSPENYRELSISSFREYADRLNWETAGAAVRDLLSEFCADRGRAAASASV